MKSKKSSTQLSRQKILEARARLLAQLPEEKSDARESLELVTFHIDHEYLGMAISLVVEAHPLKTLHWSRLPNDFLSHAPAFIVGVVNMRGHIYSITDLARFVGLPAHPISDKAHILLLRGGLCTDGKEMELTLLSDDVPQVERVLLKNLNPPPDTVSATMKAYLLGITPNMLMVLDMQRLLSDERLIVQESET